MNKQENQKDKQPPSLTPRAVFGLRSDVKENIQFFASDKCAYLAGNYVVITTIKDKVQNFFPANPKNGEITGFSVDEHRDYIMLGIAQKGEKPEITLQFINKNDFTVEENKTKKLVTSDEMELGDYFISLSLNLSKGYIIALVGPKSQSVIVYQHEYRSCITKFHSSWKLLNASIYKQISINPLNPYYFCIFGDGGYALCRFNDAEKRNPDRVEVNSTTQNYQEFNIYILNFVSCTWLSKTRIALLNSSCDVFIIDYGRKFEAPLKKVIKGVNIFESQSKGKAIFSKNSNLYVTRDDGVIIKLEEKQQSDKVINYERVQNATKFVQNLPRMEVHHLAINNFSNSTSGIFISTETSQLYYIELLNDNSLSDGNNFKHFLCSFHSEEITCLDVSKLKQLVVTCSKDKTIRIWNYLNLQLEVVQEFEEDATHVSFHPNGLHLAVGFRESLKLMNILEKSIVVYKDFNISGIRDVKFSNFGNLFGVCYKTIFNIYNYFTCEIILTCKTLEGVSHTADIMSIVWDSDDNGFATCGQDGRAYYFQLYNKDQPISVEYINRDLRFNGVGIYTNKTQDMQEVTKKLLLLDENCLVEVHSNKDIMNKKEENFSSNKNDFNKKEKPKVLIKDENFSNLIYDQDAKLIIVSSLKESAPAIKIARYPSPLDTRDFFSFQANCLGVKAMRTSFDMSNLFTSGKDKCLFFFIINNVTKNDKRDETLETDLILVKKEDLDKEVKELKSKLDKIDDEINREKESFAVLKTQLESDKNINDTLLKNEKERFAKEKLDLDQKIDMQRDHFENELDKLKKEQKEKMDELYVEHEKNKSAKEKDKEKEIENFDKEKSKDSNQVIQVRRRFNEELKTLQENYDKKISDLNKTIKNLEERKKNLNKEIEEMLKDRMDRNDNEISSKRAELEKLRLKYENFEREFKKKKAEKEADIYQRKELIKAKENKRTKERSELLTLTQENDKLTKQIQELMNDKREKDNTIIEKNNIKRELEKENQELEKFKFVLNYKIKELKHEKDPKENKLQTLEKQAKDMDREIKNFEYAQSNYLINLSVNHEIMKLYERQIKDTEKRIQKLKNYKKIFQTSLHNSLLKAGTHKEYKKELVILKRLFLDKEFIEVVEKPHESNYESQRQYLEKSIDDYKSKIESKQKLFGQDHAKLMRENMNLINIVNELEREKKEVELTSYVSEKKLNNPLKGKTTSKPGLPVFDRSKNNLEQKSYNLEKELFEIEKEIQLIRIRQKKEEEREKERKKKELREKNRAGVGIII